MHASGRVTSRTLLAAALAAALLAPMLLPAVPAAAGTDPQDAEIRAAAHQAMAGTHLAGPGAEEVWPDAESMYWWTAEFDEFRSARNRAANSPQWRDSASSQSLEIFLDGNDWQGADRIEGGTTVCGQPAEFEVDAADPDDPHERSMGADHEAQTGDDRPRGPETFFSSGYSRWDMGRFGFRLSANYFDSSPAGGAASVESFLRTLNDQLCAAFTPLVPDVPAEAPTTPTTEVPSTPPVTVPTGPVTLAAGGPGWSSDIETVANPDGFGQLDVSGRVIDLADGSGVGGVTVQATSGGTGSATTAPDGTFSLVVAVLGGTVDTGQVSGVELELSRLTGLRTAVEPPAFTSIGSSVTVVVTATDATGAPSVGEVVTLRPVDPTGDPVTATTGADGVARLVVTHDDPSVGVYRLVVEALGATSEVVIPAGGVVLEQNPATGTPYVGVVADGSSSIDIDISLTGVDRVFVPSGARGSLQVDGTAFEPGNWLDLTDGRRTLTYVPPPYLALDDLTGTVAVAERQVQTATDRVIVERILDDGTEVGLPVEITLLRPPVMLVHGFIGDLTTWQVGGTYLGERGFDTVNREYFETGAADSSIERQSDRLRANLAETAAAYATAGVKPGRADVVAHSMGGLITRNLIQESPTDHGVRKLVMVGTPNHGATWLDLQAGRVMAPLFDRHHTAAEQLYHASPFLTLLNSGEAAGGHLAPDVQYAVLAGARASLAIPGSTVPDDGVVTTASARLNGVPMWIFPDTVHSSMLIDLYGGADITRWPALLDQAITLLTNDVIRVPLRSSAVRVDAVAGSDPEVNRIDPDRWDPAAPGTDIGAGDRVRAPADGGVTLGLYLDGTRWGTVELDVGTDIQFGQVGPAYAEVRVFAGRARLVSAGGTFAVTLAPVPAADGTGWHQVVPDVLAVDVGTTFVLTADGTVSVSEGSVAVSSGDALETVGAGTAVHAGAGAITPADLVVWPEEGDGVLDRLLGSGVPLLLAAGAGLVALLLLGLGLSGVGRPWTMVGGAGGALVGIATLAAIFVLSPGAAAGVTDVADLAAEGITVVAANGQQLPDPTGAAAPTPVPAAPTPTPATPSSTQPPAPTATPTPATAAQQCTHPLYGHTVVYPQDWFVHDAADDELDCTAFAPFPLPDDLTAEYAPVYVAVETVAFDEALTMFDPATPELVHRVEFTLDGRRAVRGEFRTEDGPDGAADWMLTLVDSDPPIVVGAFSDGIEDYGVAAAVADQMVGNLVLPAAGP